MIVISLFYFVFGNHCNQIVTNIHLVFTLQAEVSFLHCMAHMACRVAWFVYTSQTTGNANNFVNLP